MRNFYNFVVERTPLYSYYKQIVMCYVLTRFIEAQEGIYDQVKKELENGYKSSHWMWYIFPQIKGLGRSYTSINYAIKSLEEAKAYLEHPILGSRLKECCQIILNLENKSAIDIFGHTDALKLKSSMTMFDMVEEGSIFEEVLQRYYQGNKDRRTISIASS